MEHRITKYFNEKVIEGHKEQPRVDMNRKLIKDFKEKLININCDYHRLQRKGIVWLLEQFENISLDYVPTNVLNNSMSPLSNYIAISRKFSINEINKEDKNSKVIEIFKKEYEKIITKLNFYIKM